MANLAAFRHGQRKVHSIACDSATVIEIGDMLFLDTDDVKPAADYTWNSDLATTQAGFANVFVGIAMHQSASGDTAAVDVDVSADSVYYYTMASDTYAYGALVGPDKASGNALLSGALEDAVATSSVARVIKAVTSAATLAYVQFAPVYNPDSNSAAGEIG